MKKKLKSFTEDRGSCYLLNAKKVSSPIEGDNNVEKCSTGTAGFDPGVD